MSLNEFYIETHNDGFTSVISCTSLDVIDMIGEEDEEKSNGFLEKFLGIF